MTLSCKYLLGHHCSPKRNMLKFYGLQYELYRIGSRKAATSITPQRLICTRPGIPVCIMYTGRLTNTSSHFHVATTKGVNAPPAGGHATYKLVHAMSERKASPFTEMHILCHLKETAAGNCNCAHALSPCLQRCISLRGSDEAWYNNVRRSENRSSRWRENRPALSILYHQPLSLASKPTWPSSIRETCSASARPHRRRFSFPSVRVRIISFFILQPFFRRFVSLHKYSPGG